MELCKTRCLDCAHMNRWHSFKWPDTEQKKEHNRVNSDTCVRCGSRNVLDLEDDEVMAPYKAAAEIFAKVVRDPREAARPEKGGVRPFVVDDALKEACRCLREHAEKTENWYVIGKSAWVPGDRPEYVVQTEFGFQFVFTITHVPEYSKLPYRHMTISVPGGRYPHNLVVWTVAHLLGFTGATVEDDIATEPGPWGIEVNENEGCVVVGQPWESIDAN